MQPRHLRLLPILLLLGCCWRTRAQAYEPGLLVQASGDTLRGEVENGFWVEPPTAIRFRATPDGPSQTFRARQLRAVRFTQGRYFRFEVLPIDHAAETRLSDLPRGGAPAVRLDSLLAEVLLDGPATLLRVVRPGSVHYPLLRPGQPPVDLCERQYLRENGDGHWQVTDGNNYRGQLLLAFTDCPAARDAALKATFTAPDLVAVAQAYNVACAPGHQPGRSWLAQARPRRRVAFQGGVLVGGRYNRLTPPEDAQDQSCPDCQVRPFGGLYADLFLPSRRAAIYGELSVSSFSNRGVQFADYVRLSSGGFSSLYSHYDYQATLGTARLGVRYFLGLPHEQQLLLGFSFELNRVMGPTVTTTAGPPATPSERELVYAPTVFFPNLGVGWRCRRFTVSLDGQSYISPTDDSLANLFIGSDMALRLGVAYRLGSNPDSAPRITAARK